jgi:hypothetical protein
MEEEKKVDECLEPLKKIVDLDFKLDRLIMERTKKEEEFKEYIREQDKIINTINEKKRIIGQTVIDIDLKNSGYLRDEVKNCLELSGIQIMGEKVVSDKGTVHTEKYKGFVSGDGEKINTKVVYGESIDEVIDSAGKLTNKAAYTTVNIGVLNPAEGEYGNFRRFDISKRFDITDVQLSLPYLEKNEFTELTKRMKEEGARFNSYVKKWYVPYDKADKEFFKPYISEIQRQRDYSRQRYYTSQELALPVGITGKTVNDMLSRYDGYVRITYEDNGKGRIVPKAEFYQNEVAEDTEHTGKWLSDANVRTVLIEGREMNKDLIYCGEGYQIEPEEEITGHTPIAAVLEETDTAGKHYCIYGIHDLSGMVFRLSPRRFDTRELAEHNIPDNYKEVNLEKLKEQQKMYEQSWSKIIKDDAKKSGYELSDYAVKNIKLLNYETNKSWSLKDISNAYKTNNQEVYGNLSERAATYIRRIGNECANMQRLELVR